MLNDTDPDMTAEVHTTAGSKGLKGLKMRAADIPLNHTCLKLHRATDRAMNLVTETVSI